MVKCLLPDIVGPCRRSECSGTGEADFQIQPTIQPWQANAFVTRLKVSTLL